MKLKTLKRFVIPYITPLIGTLIYFINYPSYISFEIKKIVFTLTLIATMAIPIVFFIILRITNIIDSFKLSTSEEKRFPLVFLSTLFFLIANLLYKAKYTPLLDVFFFGISASLIMCIIINLMKKKYNLGIVGLGNLLGFIGYLSFEFKLNLLYILSLLILIVGLRVSEFESKLSASSALVSIGTGVCCQLITAELLY